MSEHVVLAFVLGAAVGLVVDGLLVWGGTDA